MSKQQENKGKLVKICLLIITLLIILCSAFFLFKRLADKVFIDNFLQMLALSEADMNTEELKNAEVIAVDYNSKHFSQCIESLKVVKRGYFSKEDIAGMGVALPTLQLFYFKLGMSYIGLTAKQQEIMMLAMVRQLRSMSGEDFGTDENLWQKWQDEKEENN